MWWIDKFGSVSGPYSDEQIQQGIRQNRFTRLHKISSDRRNWSRLGQTAFWNPVQSAPTPLELPGNDVMSGGGGESVPKGSTSRPDALSASREVRIVQGRRDRKARTFMWCTAGVCGIAVLAFFGFLTFSAIGNRSRMSASPENFEAAKKCVVFVHTEEGNGTAFLVKMDGKKYVLTNDHVIRSKSTPKMTFVDGTELALGNLSVARDRDLARFEVTHDGEYLELAKEAPNNNDDIWIYGNSLGDGVITTLRGFVTGVGNKLLKVTAEFVGGNSGSPILGKDGKVLGVAAYIRNGERERTWSTKGTPFDSVRRFGVRLANVEWVPVDRRQYEHDCARLEQFETYVDHLSHYCCVEELEVSNEKVAVTLEHLDLDRRSFGADEGGFHEMLMAVSAAYAGQCRSKRRLASLHEHRGSVIKELNEGKLTREEGEKVLNELGQKFKTTREDFESKCRAFNAKRKEALLLARSFLTEVKWQNPLMQHGYKYREGGVEESVDVYLECIQELLDLNAQKLKNLNKDLKRLESGDDEE